MVFENHRKSRIKVYILSGQKFIKNAKIRPLENLKNAVKQYYQIGQFFRTKIDEKCQH